MTTTPAELISRYEALDEPDKNIVRLLCVNIDTMKQDSLFAGLHYLKSDKLSLDNLDKKELSTILHRLEEDGLTSKRQGATSHQPLLRNHVLLDVLDQGLFKKINLALKNGQQVKKQPYYGRTFTSLGHGLHTLQTKLFDQSSLDELSKTLQTFCREFGNIPAGESPFVALFGPTFPVPLMRHSLHRQSLGFHLCESNFNSLKLDPELVAMLLEDIRTGLATTSPFYLVLYLLFLGKMNLVTEILALSWPEHFTTDKNCLKATLLFVQGNYEAASQTFIDNLAQMKKNTGKRKAAIPGLPGIFHICSLLAIGGAQQLALGKELLEISRKQELFPNVIAHNLSVIFALQMGQTPENSFWSPESLLGYPVYRFLYYLSFWWADRDKALKVLPEVCGPLQFEAMEQDFSWLSAECSTLLANLGREPNRNKKMADELHEHCRTISCVTIVQPKDKNFQRLQGLLALAAKEHKKDGPATVSAQRLAWLFYYYSTHNTCSFTPILQKISKNGKWSGGRNVALKTLHEQNESIEGLTDQDRHICRSISRDYSYHSYGYKLDMQKAIVAAIGHPLLFLKSNPGVSVELGRGEMELRISKKGTALTLAIHPKPHDKASVFLHRESATSFKVYQLSPSQLTLTDLLKEKLELPESATEQVRELASSLSATITVHSEVGGGLEAIEVASDPSPHLHLLPFQDGLRAELFVRPLCTNGPWLQPGQGMAIVLGEQDGKRVQCKRELKKEANLCGKLMTACPALAQAQELDGQFLFPEPTESLELLCQLRDYPDCTLHWPRGQSFSLRAEAGFANLSLRINKDRDWFSTSGDLKVDEKLTLSLSELLSLLDQADDRFIPLGDGSFLALTRSLKKRLEELRAYSEKGKNEIIRFNPLAAFALDGLISSAQIKGDKAWRDHHLRLTEVVQPSVPSTLTANLREYQIQGFSWLAQLSHWRMGACLADDMGLGKTIQALAAILLLAPKGPTLVVAPLSVAGNWIEEAARFAPTLQVKQFGQGDRQEMLDSLGPFDLVISSYGLLQIEGERLAEVAWQTVILDEAQAIKNRETKRAKAAMALNAEFRMVTTGTPLENHLGELWALFNFINPGLLGNYQRFSDTFAIPIERDKDRKRLSQLQLLIRPFILRRMKHEVLQELPAKTEITLQVEMSEQEASLYEAQRRTALTRLEAGRSEGQHLQILAEIMKLRRLCCNPALLMPETGIASSKLKVFGDILEELLENKHKALVFSQFVDHLAILRAFLDEKKIPYQYLDGATPAAHRKERITRFQSGTGEVFLISLKAGGAGLNLTAADYVIHMDPWWNPAVEDQASDRAHRIGQERPVTVYRLVMKGSIEEQIVALHKDKRDLADSLLDGASAAGKLNAGELLSLIRGSTPGSASQGVVSAPQCL